MIIGVIGAMQIEIDNLKKTLENPSYESISGVEFVKGTIGGTEVVAADIAAAVDNTASNL